MLVSSLQHSDSDCFPLQVITNYWVEFPVLVGYLYIVVSLFSLITQSCPTLCDPMDCSIPGFPVHHQLSELAQIHVHRVSDAIQPSHPLSSPSPPAFNISQHQGLFQGVGSLHKVAKLLEFQYWSIVVSTLFLFYLFIFGFPGGSEGKASACNVGDWGSIPGLVRSLGEGKGNPFQYSCLEKPMDGGAW